MDIKRNIFESSAKMPASYEPCAVPMPQSTESIRPLPQGYNPYQSDVRHAPSPRIGDK